MLPQASEAPSSAQDLAEVLGTREQISFGEFDGRRRKRLLAKIIGE
jgi:thiamine phosphate synthase YjbQ (UPF0047 family)